MKYNLTYILFLILAITTKQTLGQEKKVSVNEFDKSITITYGPEISKSIICPIFFVVSIKSVDTSYVKGIKGYRINSLNSGFIFKFPKRLNTLYDEIITLFERDNPIFFKK
jgi:hypothetical protein